MHEAEQAKIFNQLSHRQKGIEKIEGKIVLIEDNTPVRESLAALLRSWGADVFEAEGYSDDLAEKVKEWGPPDAVISDFNLGEVQATGLECILRLSMAEERALPALLLTAVSSDVIDTHYVRTLRVLGEREAALFAMPRILQKPVTGDSLNSAVRELIGEKSRQIPTSKP